MFLIVTVVAADREWRPMFTLALRTGLRIGELRALRWDDVDLVSGRLVVRRCDWRGHIGTPKSGRNRELPLSGEAVAALKAHRHLRGELVFCKEGGRAFKENECKWPCGAPAEGLGCARSPCKSCGTPSPRTW